jgi:hypothetical protein
MSRPCLTCQHLHRAAIDRRLASGEPLKRLAAEYGLSHTNLRRHRNNCIGIAAAPIIMKQAAKASAALAILPTRDELGQAYVDLRTRIDDIVQEARGAGSLAVALQGLTGIRQTLDSLTKLSLPASSQPTQVTVNVELSINAAVQQIVEAIGPAPSLEQLRRLEVLADAA